MTEECGYVAEEGGNMVEECGSTFCTLLGPNNKPLYFDAVYCPKLNLHIIEIKVTQVPAWTSFIMIFLGLDKVRWKTSHTQNTRAK